MIKSLTCYRWSNKLIAKVISVHYLLLSLQCFIQSDGFLIICVLQLCVFFHCLLFIILLQLLRGLELSARKWLSMLSDEVMRPRQRQCRFSAEDPLGWRMVFNWCSVTHTWQMVPMTVAFTTLLGLDAEAYVKFRSQRFLVASIRQDLLDHTFYWCTFACWVSLEDWPESICFFMQRFLIYLVLFEETTDCQKHPHYLRSTAVCRGGSAARCTLKFLAYSVVRVL